MRALFAEAGERCGWPEAVLFDLDGTLVDSVPDIATAVNKLLALEKLPALAIEEVRTMIGNGITKLVERAFAARSIDLEGAALEAMADRMMDIYGEHLTVETTLMPGARDVVTAYAKAGVKIAVVTNKPEAFSRTIVEHLGLGRSVHAIVGGDTGPVKKPEPDMLIHALDMLRVSRQRGLMVGDSPADIGAAKAVPMACVAVRGGYTTVPADDLGADVVIDALGDLPRAIERLKEPA